MKDSLRLALFADSAPQFLERALRSHFEKRGLPAEVRSWAFTTPLAVKEELEAFRPTTVLLWAASEAARFPNLEEALALPYSFVVYTMATRDDGVYGHLAATQPQALRARILAWNAALFALAEQTPNLDVIDLDLLQSQLGRANTFDARLWEAASMALTPQATDLLAKRTVDFLAARQGLLRKVLVTDLDDTMWSGIVSEVGVEGIDPEGPGRKAYRAWLKALAQRGILLAVASRNDLDLAQKAFTHPAMELNPEDFVAFEADWGRKSEMLKRIAEHCHVATSALVFLDDRAEQRAEVRAELPEVLVPELPEDPARWPEFLAQANLFEVDRLTEEDALRAASLKAEQARAQSSDPATWEQVLTPEPLGPLNIARAAQLTQRCNQFNLCNTRHTEAELTGKRGWVYRLKDRFGDLGIVSAVVLEGDRIETWVLSCRALHRGVETLILNHLKAQGPLRGEYVPTERNALCKDVLKNHGVEP